MTTRKVLVTCRQMQHVLDRFRPEFDARDIELIVPEVPGQFVPEEDLEVLIADVEGVIAGDDPFSARVLNAGPRLRIVSKWGIGTDAIDRVAAGELGIAVTNTPGVFSDEVADIALGYVLMLARQLDIIDRAVRDGYWLKPVGESLNGKSAVVVGFGAIGGAIAVRARAFGMRVIAVDPSPVARQRAAEIGAENARLDDAIAMADYLILAAPMSPDNEHLIGAAELAQMPRGRYLVNVARGLLVEEPGLVDALRSGQLAGAALDVFESEPLPATSELRRGLRVIFGSHNGSNTAEGVLRASQAAVDNLLRCLDGGVTPCP